MRDFIITCFVKVEDEVVTHSSFLLKEQRQHLLAAFERGREKETRCDFEPEAEMEELAASRAWPKAHVPRCCLQECDSNSKCFLPLTLILEPGQVHYSCLSCSSD